MSALKLLIVEDDSAQIETWKRQIDRFNAVNNVECTAEYAKTQELAIQLIQSNKYDAAIIDIRLQNNEGVKDATSGGNEVRDLLLKSEIVLVAHVTGEPGEVHYDDTRYEDLVRVFTKGDSTVEGLSVHEEILAWFLTKLDIISTMRTVKENITAKMADLFYSSIWPRWDSWKVGFDQDEGFASLSVARHMSSHLYSEFLKVSDGKVHPEEWYFQPPSIDRFNTGDVVKKDADFYVLITPRCDIERIKDNDTLLFARLDYAENWSVDIEELGKNVTALETKFEEANDEKKKEKIKIKISNVYSNFRQKYYGHKSNNFKYHFLPEIKATVDNVHGPFFVNFSDIMTVRYGEDIAGRLLNDKVASISSEFIPSLVQRLGAFMSRIGSPDYSHVY